MAPWKNSLITDFPFWSSRVLFIYYNFKYHHKTRSGENVRLTYLDIYTLVIFCQFSLILLLSLSLGSASWHCAPLPESPPLSVPNSSKNGLSCGGICILGMSVQVWKKDTLIPFHPDHDAWFFLGIFNINKISLFSHLSCIDFSSFFKLLKIILWFLFIHHFLLANP